MFDGALDANVLIDFLAARAIDRLAEFFAARAFVVQHIRENELAKGVAAGRPDPCTLNGQVWIQVIDDLDTDEYQLANDLVLRLGERHRGEAETIAVCLHRNLTFCSRDEDAIKQALSRNVTTFKTTDILNEMIASGFAPYDEVLKVAEKMAHRGINPADIRPPTITTP